VTRHTSNYGVPVNTDDPAAPPTTRIDLAQTRADLSGELTAPFLIFDTARLRFGYGDYIHKELDDGVVGTRFLNNQWEGRAELVERQMGTLGGAMGVQAGHRKFRVIGDESFVPPSLTDQIGLFTVQRLDLGAVSLEGGARVERQWLSARDIGYDRHVTSVSASAGASWKPAPDWLVGLSLYRTERAPTAEEVLSDGPHGATFSFERGDRSLGKEVATGAEATVKKSAGPVTATLNAYYTRYRDFISEQLTGALQDGLQVVQFTPVRARFWGFEAEATALVWQQGARHVHVDLQADYVNAQDLTNGQPLPRIPPLRLTGGVAYEQQAVSARAEVQWARRQDRAGPFELPTDGYTSLNVSLDWHPLEGRDLTLTLQGRNLTDQDIRYSTSFLKDRLPAPGREVRVGVRTGF
jgi:iron complex outermembrane receptor protein